MTCTNELLALTSCATDTPPAASASPLANTSWRLVRFEVGDDRVLTPANPSTFTVQFNADDSVSVRFECNRGRGTWKSAAPPQLELGPLAMTRALCADMALHDQITRQWTYIRSYVLRDSHLFLWLMADGGIYELEPL